jgi:hypothetical protein
MSVMISSEMVKYAGELLDKFDCSLMPSNRAIIALGSPYAHDSQNMELAVGVEHTKTGLADESLVLFGIATNLWG